MSDPDEVVERAKIIANDPGMYVEARVGSQNHRGQCCRVVYGRASYNDRADDTIRLFAERIVADNGATEREAEMIQALEACLRWIERDEGIHGRTFGCGNLARRALKKARPE